jgi:uncharacterized protein
MSIAEVGYRREIKPHSVLGGSTGALLLLVLPAEAFRTIVPVLIALGLVMVVCGPALQRHAAASSVRQLAVR